MLLQLVSVVGPVAGSSIVVCRCPDCDREDAVVVDDVVVQVWQRREASIRRELAADADRLRRLSGASSESSSAAKT